MWTPTRDLTMLSTLLTAFSCIIYISGTNARELGLLGLLPMTGDGWSGGGACLPATQMAIEDVNANRDILKNYNLTYTWIDSKCDPGTAVYGMNERLHAHGDTPYVMLLGAGCSVASTATAQVSHHWNLTQFSYASSSPILSDRKRFPRFFRLALPDHKLNPARVALMRTFNWRKVATINQALEFFSAVTDDFVRSVRNTDIAIISQEIFGNDPLTRVEHLKELDARIIMTAMYENSARKVLCAAYKVRLYGPKLIWVFVGWFSEDFWKINLDEVNCTEDEMSQAAEGSFITGPVYSNPENERGIANMTAHEFEQRYYNYPTYNKDTKHYDLYSYQCYDHIWVAAKALDCTIQRLGQLDPNKTLDTFTYKDSNVSDIIFHCMENTTLLGVSGTVVFSSGADPNRIVQIERIQDGTRQVIGLYRQDKDPKYFEWIDGAIKWKDGEIPRDSTDIINEEIKISLSLYVTMTCAAGIGTCLAISLFVFNVIFREKRVVKLSSPNINNVLLLGCIFCYSTIFMKTIEIEHAAMCKIRIFCFSFGFAVTFGSLFAKTWRVHRIFINKRLRKRSIKDYQLLAMVGVLVAVIVAVIIVWEIIGPHHIQTQFLPKEVYTIGHDAEVRPFLRVCQSEYSNVFGWVLCIVQGVVLLFGTFLAWETRQVKMHALNDSRQIGLCVYNVVILSTVGLTLTLLLKDEEVLLYGITSGCLILGTTLTQIILFLPKIQAVRNKMADDVTMRSDVQSSAADSCNTDVAKIQSVDMCISNTTNDC